MFERYFIPMLIYQKNVHCSLEQFLDQILDLKMNENFYYLSETNLIALTQLSVLSFIFLKIT